MKIDFTRLRHILAVDETRSFSRAADQVHITQPALSRSIAMFEREFGLRLFDRGRSGATPTAAGHLVVERAREILSSVRELESSLGHYQRGDEGELAIGMGPLAASTILPELSRRMLRSRPRLLLRSAIKSPDVLLGDLLADRLEVVFGNTWQLSELEVEIDPAGRLPLAIMVRGGHPLAARHGLTVADLEPFPVASSVERPGTGHAGAAGGFVCDNYHILRETVLESDCVWFAPPGLAAADLAAGRLVALDIAEHPKPASEISVIRRRGKTLSPAARLAIAEVRKILAG